MRGDTINLDGNAGRQIGEGLERMRRRAVLARIGEAKLRRELDRYMIDEAYRNRKLESRRERYAKEGK